MIHTVPASLAIFQSHLLSHLSVCIQVASDGPPEGHSVFGASGGNFLAGLHATLPNPVADPSSSSTDRRNPAAHQPPAPLQNPWADLSSSSTDRLNPAADQPPAEPPAAAFVELRLGPEELPADWVAPPHAQGAFYEACRACEGSPGSRPQRSYHQAAAVLDQVLCLLTEDRLTRIRMHSTSHTLFVHNGHSLKDMCRIQLLVTCSAYSTYT